MPKVLINYCSARELLDITGIGQASVDRIMDLRGERGDLSVADLKEIPHLKVTEEMVDRIDFSPFAPVRRNADEQEPKMSTYKSGSARNWEPTQTTSYSTEWNRQPPQVWQQSKEWHTQPPSSWNQPTSGWHAQSMQPPTSGWQTQPTQQWQRPPMKAQEQSYSAWQSQGPPPMQPPSGWQPQGWQQPPASPAWQSPPQRLNASHQGGGTKYPPIPRTISYDGTGSWRAFYAKFHSYAEEQQWNGKQRKNYLCWVLQGKASEYFANLVERESTLEYFDLVRYLEKRFAEADLPETWRLHFASLRQRADEPIRDWADRVSLIGIKAYKEMPDHHMQKELVIKFCQGCNDKEAGLYALNKRCTTLEEAINHVQWSQHTTQVMHTPAKQDQTPRQRNMVRQLSSGASNYGDWEGEEEHEGVRKVDLNSQGHTIQGRTTSPSWEKRFASIEDKLGGVQRSIDGLADAIRGLVNSRRDRSRTPTRVAVAQPARCFNCEGTGHFRRDCPKEPARESKVVCYGCGQPGHYKGDCPRQKKQVNFTAEDSDLNCQGLEWKADRQSGEEDLEA